MAVTITISPTNVSDVLERVYELRDRGLVQGVHFDFKYVPPQHEWLDNGTPANVEFTFYDEQLASFYILKWQ